MILLLNTTKTMDLVAKIPAGLELTAPRYMGKSSLLAEKISQMNQAQLGRLMALSDKLAEQTKTNADLWGKDGQPKIAAVFGFTGPLYKALDPGNLTPAQLKSAQKKLRILSGLYGLLRPLDQVEAYRLEMGLKLTTGKTKNIIGFWKKTLTDRLNKDLKKGEPVLSVAAQEYLKALDLKTLIGPVISPVFKEEKPDGTLKNVAVHAKKARGAFIRHALETNAQTAQDLKGFNSFGWKAAQEPPEAGPWLFTRPASV